MPGCHSSGGAKSKPCCGQKEWMLSNVVYHRCSIRLNRNFGEKTVGNIFPSKTPLEWPIFWAGDIATLAHRNQLKMHPCSRVTRVNRVHITAGGGHLMFQMVIVPFNK